MLNINRIVIVVVCITCVAIWPTSPVFSGPIRAEIGPANRIAKALNLTDEQRAQLKPILESIRARVQSIKSDPSLTTPQRRQKFKALRLEIHTKIDRILTPAQQSELAVLRSKMRKEHWGQQGGPQQPPRDQPS